MSRLLELLGIGMPTAVSPDDPRWWGGTPVSEAGVRVTADSAMTLSTFWACVRFLSETIGSLPIMIYRREADGTRGRATDNPLYDVLQRRPNDWQTAVEFKSMMQGHALLRGNAYAHILPGRRGAVDQLVPIHPDRVKIERLSNGRLRYMVAQKGRPALPYTPEEIFHLRGMSSDGVTGMSVIDYAANSVGLTMAAERYGSRFFKNDSRPGGILTTDKKLGTGTPERMRARWRETQAGSHRGDVAILEEGLDFKAIGVPPEEAQFLQTREHQALDVCRWFGVAPHMVGVPGSVTEWGSGLEQLGRGVVTYTLMPWMVRWQEAIGRDLIIAPQTYYAEFVTEALLRGDTAARYEAYATARQWGWVSVNEIRRWENMNPVEGGDVYLQPMNMTDAESATADTATNSGALVTPKTAMSAPNATNGVGVKGANGVGVAEHYQLLARSAAGRLVRKELAALDKEQERAGDDLGAWHTAVADFYQAHAALVADTMQVNLFTAAAYCQYRIGEWLMDSGAAEANELKAIDALVMLATETDNEDEDEY